MSAGPFATKRLDVEVFEFGKLCAGRDGRILSDYRTLWMSQYFPRELTEWVWPDQAGIGPQGQGGPLPPALGNGGLLVRPLADGRQIWTVASRMIYRPEVPEAGSDVYLAARHLAGPCGVLSPAMIGDHYRHTPIVGLSREDLLQLEGWLLQLPLRDDPFRDEAFVTSAFMYLFAGVPIALVDVDEDALHRFAQALWREVPASVRQLFCYAWNAHDDVNRHTMMFSSTSPPPWAAAYAPDKRTWRPPSQVIGDDGIIAHLQGPREQWLAGGRAAATLRVQGSLFHKPIEGDPMDVDPARTKPGPFDGIAVRLRSLGFVLADRVLLQAFLVWLRSDDSSEPTFPTGHAPFQDEAFKALLAALGDCGARGSDSLEMQVWRTLRSPYGERASYLLDHWKGPPPLRARLLRQILLRSDLGAALRELVHASATTHVPDFARDAFFEALRSIFQAAVNRGDGIRDARDLIELLANEAVPALVEWCRGHGMMVLELLPLDAGNVLPVLRALRGAGHVCLIDAWMTLLDPRAPARHPDLEALEPTERRLLKRVFAFQWQAWSTEVGRQDRFTGWAEALRPWQEASDPLLLRIAFGVPGLTPDPKAGWPEVPSSLVGRVAPVAYGAFSTWIQVEYGDRGTISIKKRLLSVVQAWPKECTFNLFGLQDLQFSDSGGSEDIIYRTLPRLNERGLSIVLSFWGARGWRGMPLDLAAQLWEIALTLDKPVGDHGTRIGQLVVAFAQGAYLQRDVTQWDAWGRAVEFVRGVIGPCVRPPPCLQLLVENNPSLHESLYREFHKQGVSMPTPLRRREPAYVPVYQERGVDQDLIWSVISVVVASIFLITVISSIYEPNIIDMVSRCLSRR